MLLIFLIVFFIVFVVSYVFLVYKLKLLDDDVETLYDKYSEYIANSFSGGIKHD